MAMGLGRPATESSHFGHWQSHRILFGVDPHVQGSDHYFLSPYAAS